MCWNKMGKWSAQSIKEMASERVPLLGDCYCQGIAIAFKRSVGTAFCLASAVKSPWSEKNEAPTWIQYLHNNTSINCLTQLSLCNAKHLAGSDFPFRRFKSALQNCRSVFWVTTMLQAHSEPKLQGQEFIRKSSGSKSKQGLHLSSDQTQNWTTYHGTLPG